VQIIEIILLKINFYFKENFTKIFTKGIKIFQKNKYMTRIYQVVPPVTDINDKVKLQ
jgi:hypothetical protein